MTAFFFDNDANMRITHRLAQLGHSVTSAAVQHLARASDEELLHYAGRAGLILVTHNERDSVRLQDVSPQPHMGIIVVPQAETPDYRVVAVSIDNLVGAGLRFAGECYRLRATGWERRTEDRHWERV